MHAQCYHTNVCASVCVCVCVCGGGVLQCTLCCLVGVAHHADISTVMFAVMYV